MNQTLSLIIAIVALLGFSSCQQEPENNPPNILFCIADDASYPHMGAYGTDWIKTPGFDRIAQQGLLFMNAYTPNAKCAPSRSCILTGRNSWQLEEAANHVPDFPEKFASWFEVLKENGYFTGFTGKGWAPGNPGTKNGKVRELTGKAFQNLKTDPPSSGISSNDYTANFAEFLKEVPENQSWCFWYGGFEPHRRYEYGSGIAKGGKNIMDVGRVPEIWPDVEVIRTDMLDYAFEIEYFDMHVVNMIEILKERGELDNTIIVVTADNGMPFPRIKGQEYEASNHLPLAIMWPDGIKNPGRKVEKMVSFIDFAPTFLQAAEIDWKESGIAESPGKSLMDIFNDRNAGREYVVFGKERHDIGRPDDVGYPIRGIVKDDYLYLINYEPSRWPAGNPETGYLNCDGGATKSFILNLRRENGDSYFWQLNFGKRPSEEFYNIKNDPDCLNNLASDNELAGIKEELKELLMSELQEQNDPRVLGNGQIFDEYPYGEEKMRDFYNRYMSGEKLHAGWVNEDDFEKEIIE